MFRFGFTAFFAFFLFCLTIQGYAGSATITANKDLHVRIDNDNNHNNTKLNIRDEEGTHGSHTGDKTHHAVVQFEIQSGHIIDEANLLLDLIEFKKNGATAGGEAYFYVFGIKDGASEEDFDEDSLTYMDWLESNGSGIWDNTGANQLGVYSISSSIQAEPSSWFRTILGSFTVSADDLNQTVSMSGTDFVEFLNEDTNGIITLLITRYTGDGDLSTRFASTEHDTYAGPRLLLEVADREITVSEDLFVKYGDSTNYGGAGSLAVKNIVGEGSTERKVLMEFDIGSRGDYKNVELMLDVKDLLNGTWGRFYVYGVNDGVTGENLDEDSDLYSDFPFLDDSSDGVDNNSYYLYNDGVNLGTFDITSDDVNQTVVFSSEALTDMVNDDTNGKITLVLSRWGQGGSYNSLWTTFASKDEGTLNPPRLYLRPNLEKGTETVDMEITYAYVDNDSDPEMVLVLNNPDGGGTVVADPFAIADYLVQIGYGLGTGTQFFDSLSPTQQSGLLNAYEAVEVSQSCIGSASVNDLDSDELAGMYANLSGTRNYPVVTFDNRADLVAGIDDGGVQLEASYSSCTLLDITLGNFSVTIDGPSASAALSITDSRATIGAEASLYTVSASYGNNSGTAIGISTGAGVGGVYDVAYGDGLYGATFPISANITLSVYISAEDAEYVYNTIMEGHDLAHDQFESWVGSDVYDELDRLGILDEVDIIAQVHNAYNMVVNIERTNEEAYIFIKQEGREALVVLEGTAAQLSNDTVQALDQVGQVYTGAATNAADELESWAGTASSTLVGIYDDATDWVEDTASNIGNSIKKGLKKLFG